MTSGQGFDDRPEAVRLADAGTVAWRAVVHAQQSATPDHADFYGLAGSLVDTLAAVAALARLLARQVDGYADSVAGTGEGFAVYDDSRSGPAPVDPRERLAGAVAELEDLAVLAGSAAVGKANAFWNAIGHIGAEPTREEPADGAPTDGGADR